MTRKVYECLTTISLYDLDGPLNNTIDKLLELKETYPDKELTLDLRNQTWDDGKEYAVLWERPENEEEMKKRQEEEQKNKEYRRKQYESLKKEFE